MLNLSQLEEDLKTKSEMISQDLETTKLIQV